MADQGLSPMPVAQGYPLSSSSTPSRSFSGLCKRRMVQLLLVAMLIFMIRNLISKDYNSEAKSYLRSIGHPELIDEVIPKSSEDIQKEKNAQIKSLNDLFRNMTIVQTDMETLKKDIKVNNDLIKDTDGYISVTMKDVMSNVTSLSNQVKQLAKDVQSLKEKSIVRKFRV